MQTHTEETHHADVESIQQVKGQCGNEIDKEPGGDVVDADGAGVVHYLTRSAHKCSSKVQQYVCRGRQQKQELQTQQHEIIAIPHGCEEHTEQCY